MRTSRYGVWGNTFVTQGLSDHGIVFLSTVQDGGLIRDIVASLWSL